MLIVGHDLLKFSAQLVEDGQFFSKIVRLRQESDRSD